jgi:maltose O-acetyltransferase
MSVHERRQSRPEWAAPVTLGDDAFVGSNVRILKGVCIGEGSIVANSSVVTKSVPPGVVVAGVPAKIVRAI